MRNTGIEYKNIAENISKKWKDYNQTGFDQVWNAKQDGKIKIGTSSLRRQELVPAFLNKIFGTRIEPEILPIRGNKFPQSTSLYTKFNN